MSYLPRKDHGDKSGKKKEKGTNTALLCRFNSSLGLKAIVEPTLKLIPLVLPVKAAPPVPAAQQTEKTVEQADDSEEATDMPMAEKVRADVSLANILLDLQR